MLIIPLLCTFLPPLSLPSCCGAGTAADTEYTTEMISADVELHRLATGRKVNQIILKLKLLFFTQPRVATACRLLKQYLHR